jgi:hypothetical protein
VPEAPLSRLRCRGGCRGECGEQRGRVCMCVWGGGEKREQAPAGKRGKEREREGGSGREGERLVEREAE